MAHPDPHRAGAERDQRRHAGQTNEQSDLGQQDKSQSRPGTHAAQRREDAQRSNAGPKDGDAGGASRDASQRGSGDIERDDPHNAPESGDKPDSMIPAGRSSAQRH